MDPIAAIIAPCPQSIYKDERHIWVRVMQQGTDVTQPTDHFEFQHCTQCDLLRLIHVPLSGVVADAANLYAIYMKDVPTKVTPPIGASPASTVVKPTK